MKEELDQAYQNLRLAKHARDRHAINKWKHRIKILEGKLKEERNE